MGTVADYRMKRAPLSGRFWSERHQHGNPAAIEIVGTALSGETALSFAAPVGGNSWVQAQGCRVTPRAPIRRDLEPARLVKRAGEAATDRCFCPVTQHKK